MDKGARVYREILRLVRRLPKDTRPYYAQYLRENIVNYPKIFDRDFEIMDELFRRAYNHSIWVLNKVLIPPFFSHSKLRTFSSFRFLLTHLDFLVNAVFGGSIGRG
jgi:hypothetical protein